LGSGVDGGQDVTRVDRVAFLRSQRTKDARLIGRDVDVHLLGLQLHQRLAGLDGFTLMLQPGPDRGFHDRLAQNRHAHLNRHVPPPRLRLGGPRR
jgi:hypothetical protein